MHQVVKMQLANKRQGTQSAKTRAEVRGAEKSLGDKKVLVEQDTVERSPQWTHGGIVFAPKPRDYSYTFPKKVKRLALKSALSTKVMDNEILY